MARRHRSGRLLTRLLLLSGAALFLCAADPAPATARKSDPPFGPNDVETVFFISKSDDSSRVDYWLRLDEHCRPDGQEALVPYWREFENGVFARTHSSTFFDRLGYGVAKQTIVRMSEEGGELVARLKPVSREMVIVTSRAADGRCRAVARTRIAGVEGAVLANGFVKLKTKLSVEYVELHGQHPETRAELSERLNP